MVTESLAAGIPIPTLLLFLAAGLFLPLFPLSMGVNWLLQQAADGDYPQLARPGIRLALLVGLPLLGIGCLLLGLALAGEQSAQPLMLGFAFWGALSSVFYAFRLLSARDGRIWIAQLYSSALALIWIGLAQGVDPLPPTLGLVAALLPLLWLFERLRERFGIARSGLYPGLGMRMPRFSALFIAAVLFAVAVPLSPAFFALMDLTFFGDDHHEWLMLLPIGLSWLFWTWAGINLLTGIVFGVPREDLAYRDLDQADVWRVGFAMFALAIMGLLLIREVL